MLLAWMFLTQPILAQVDYTPRFTKLLEQAQLDIYTPLENSYRDVPVWRDAAAFQLYDFAMDARQEDLEIRYRILPYDAKNLLFFAPHVESWRLALHLARNDDAEEDRIITYFDIKDEVLKEAFNADWGMTFFFHPKSVFSSHEHCKLLALYSEGKGMAFVLFLFDEPSEELEKRFVALRFRTENAN
jgi:hypothetical protein